MAVEVAAVAARSGLAWPRLRAPSRGMAVSLAICLPIAAIAVAAPLIAPYDPSAIAAGSRLMPPTLAHPMGTDNLGRDVLSRAIYGARVSLLVGTLAVVFGCTVGTAIGVVAGFTGGAPDEALMRVMDAILAFPAILLALVLLAVLGPGLAPTIVAIAATRVPIFARTSRSLVLSERRRDYVEASRALGQGAPGILTRHVAPNILPPIVVLASTYLASAIVAEAGLSFLGLGTVPPDVSWGTMLSDSRPFLESHPWVPLFPGLAISLTVLGFNLLGDAFRDLLDPRTRAAQS